MEGVTGLDIHYFNYDRDTLFFSVKHKTIRGCCKYNEDSMLYPIVVSTSDSEYICLVIRVCDAGYPWIVL